MMRKLLIKIAKRIEANWHKVDAKSRNLSLEAGWYVTEFVVQGAIQHTPKIIVRTVADRLRERILLGVHSGRNRMLIYLPKGILTAHSDSIDFTLLARVPSWEGRARVLLICFRYLIDFFSPFVLLRMIAMQFKKPFDLSTQLLTFYTSPTEVEGYLHSVQRWQRLRPYRKQLAWLYRKVKIGVVIQSNQQRQALEEMMVAPDLIVLASDSEVGLAEMDYVIPLDRTETLNDAAIIILKRLLKKANKRNNITMFYTDHDYALSENSSDEIMEPVFKPSPSAVYLHCFNFIGPAVGFSVKCLADMGSTALFDPAQRYKLSLQLIESRNRVLHVSDVLFTSERQRKLRTPEPTSPESPWPDINWERKDNYNVLRADPDWQNQPSVDLLIPTRDGLQVLRPCIESILEKTQYPNYQIIIADNGSELKETHDFFAEVSKDDRVSIVEYPGEFNYSAINNFAAKAGNSEYVALVNNDIEVIHSDWLTHMMVWAKQDSVGIVGAKLLFGNGLVQHAGVTIGMGNAAGHIHRLESGESLGYQNRCAATQNMMAVTAACLITPRELFESLGGLNEVDFKVAYNDIDYCLRVESMGLDVIWTPEATLYHHESVSRGDDMSEQHINRYFKELAMLQKTWKTKGFVDKYYSKHLRISDEGVYPKIAVKGKDQLRYLSQ